MLAAWETGPTRSPSKAATTLRTHRNADAGHPSWDYVQRLCANTILSKLMEMLASLPQSSPLKGLIRLCEVSFGVCPCVYVYWILMRVSDRLVSPQ